MLVVLIGEFDMQVFHYIKQLRAARGNVNRNIVLADTNGIIIFSHKKPSLLKKYGGWLDLGKKCFYNAGALSKERLK